MKILNASLLPLEGEKKRVTFSLTEILLEGTIDTYNKTLIKRGTPYDLNSLQWEILDVPAEIEEIPVTPEETEQPVEPVTSEESVKPENE